MKFFQFKILFLTLFDKKKVDTSREQLLFRSLLRRLWTVLKLMDPRHFVRNNPEVNKTGGNSDNQNKLGVRQRGFPSN